MKKLVTTISFSKKYYSHPPRFGYTANFATCKAGMKPTRMTNRMTAVTGYCFDDFLYKVRQHRHLSGHPDWKNPHNPLPILIFQAPEGTRQFSAEQEKQTRELFERKPTHNERNPAIGLVALLSSFF